MSNDDNMPFRALRDSRVVTQLRPLVRGAIVFARDELEPRILAGLARQKPPFTLVESLAFVDGLADAAVTKVTKNLSEFDRDVFRSAVMKRLETLRTMLVDGYYPTKGRES